MATFIMLPDGVTDTNDWQNYGGGTADHTLVDDDTFTGGSYIYETGLNKVVTFTMTNPSVAEEDIDTINHVTVKLKAFYSETGESRTLDVTQHSEGYQGLADTHTVTASIYPLYTGASRQYWHHTTSWTYAALGDLQVKLKLTAGAARHYYMRVSYIYAEVDYDVAVVTDNATFFGTNF